MSASREFLRLFEAEYDNRAEFAVRLAVVGLSAVVLYLYTGWGIAFLWVGLYFGLHLVYWLYFALAFRGVVPQSVSFASGMYLALIAAFIWMPAYLFQFEDLALRVPSSAALGAFLMFMIRRADTSRVLVIGQVLAVLGTVTVVVVLTADDIDNWMAQSVVVIAGLGLVGYFAQSLLAARTRRLRSEEAMQANVQVQKMEAIGRLAGGVAHDFNNMLTVILGNLELHELAETESDRRETLDAARHAAERARETVRQLMSFSRSAELTETQCDLVDIARRSVLLAQPLVTSAITLRLNQKESSLPVLVDESHLLTALLNLVINAKDALDGSGVITVCCDRIETDQPVISAEGRPEPPGCYARIAVRDTGPGIPAEIRHLVLEPFFTTKPLGKGTGLGLAMVAGFARQSKGFIQIDSSPNGTEVGILLPDLPAATLAPSAGHAAPERSSARAPETRPEQAAAGKT
ncbi:sensor histidine kinase [Mesobacterium pallidum]|uniref:sensor histidine kinase n=1 Tax=Mesobacterium pallidum TaxID=2872037 RepID=UPI001EE1B050|nr:ATP-binding protein [Mesobacterium pallidum]